MSEIEVGEYIRTRDGIIGKITKVIDGIIFYVQDYDNIPFKTDIYETIIKSRSKNIIDLIEVGDIVKTGIETIFTQCFDNKDNLDYFKELYKNEEHCIKSILTHEQYEQNCYKVGDIE